MDKFLFITKISFFYIETEKHYYSIHCVVYHVNGSSSYLGPKTLDIVLLEFRQMNSLNSFQK